MAETTGRTTNRFTIEEALQEAKKLLEETFDEAEQDAAVQLATFLYGTHERDEFIRREERRESPRDVA